MNQAFLEWLTHGSPAIKNIEELNISSHNHIVVCTKESTGF